MMEIDDHLSEIANHDLMTRALQNELYAQLDILCPERLKKNGPKKPPENCLPVIEQIAGKLYRLVISQVNRFASRRRKLEFNDLVQEGVCGLLIAIWRFDNSKGYKITTFATWWIQQAIRRAIAMKSRTIRIPVHTNDMLLKIDGFIKNHEKLNGDSPTSEQIMEALELSSKSFQLLLARKALSVSPSLDAIIETDHGSHSFYAFLPSHENYDLLFLSEEVDCLLESVLNAREERIIRLRFGIGRPGSEKMTLEKISLRFGLTRERVRQIEKEALGKLRKAGGVEALKEYL